MAEMGHDDDTELVSAGDLMDDCLWIYVPEADRYPETGPKLDDSGYPGDGYTVVEFFDLDPHTLFHSREEALAALRASYRGPDDYGVGLEMPSS
jgi:hypothetical protein